MSNSTIEPLTVMTSITIAASGTANSKIIDLNALGCTGSINVQYEVTGDGTGKIEWQQTSIGTSQNLASNFVKPSGGYTLATALTDESGTDSNGQDSIVLSTSACTYLQLIVTETGTSNSITVTLTVTVN